jgi:hypothetical protein
MPRAREHGGEGGALSACPAFGIKLAGDINAKVTDSASLDELIAKLKGELHRPTSALREGDLAQPQFKARR